MVIAAPLGITTSISRDARAAAAPAAAPAAPPITAPFVFFPRSLPTIAPATAPPATLAASAFVTPRPFMTVSIATTEASIEWLLPGAVTLVTDNSILPVEFGFGAGSAAVIVPETVAPAGITTRPVASFTSWLTVAVNESPAFAERVEIVSLAVAGTRVPAASIRGAGFAATGFFTGAFFSGAGFAASVAGGGTSFRAAVDSVDRKSTRLNSSH